MYRTAVLVVLGFVLASCGGKVEESIPAQATATNAPPPSCASACERIRACTARDDAECERSCGGDLDARGGAAYAECVDALSCQTIERGLYMDWGPLGECYAKGRAAMRTR